MTTPIDRESVERDAAGTAALIEAVVAVQSWVTKLIEDGHRDTPETVSVCADAIITLTPAQKENPDG